MIEIILGNRNKIFFLKNNIDSCCRQIVAFANYFWNLTFILNKCCRLYLSPKQNKICRHSLLVRSIRSIGWLFCSFGQKTSWYVSKSIFIGNKRTRKINLAHAARSFRRKWNADDRRFRVFTQVCSEVTELLFRSIDPVTSARSNWRFVARPPTILLFTVRGSRPVE